VVESMKVELVYFAGCPHVEEARTNLAKALLEVGLDQDWTEWDVDDPATPEDYRYLPSPTVLVAGQDVAPMQEAAGRACRASGALGVEVLTRVLRGLGPRA
jgi:hypothetical protein